MYSGDWQQGDMSGFGSFTWPNGRIYEGEWLANRRHGVGKLTSAQGQVIHAGHW